MIALFRAFLNTWAARIFFLLLVGVFVAWGVGSDVMHMMTDDPAVAVVGSRRIELPEATEAYRRQLAQVTRTLGTNIEPTPEIRRAVAGQALQGLIVQAAVENGVTALGLTTPDDAVRTAIQDMAAFKGPDGSFSRDQFNAVLRNNSYTEPRFIALMRADLTQRQFFGAVRAGSVSPDTLTRAVYAFQHETRIATAVSFPFLTAPKPDAPTEAQLARWYENHKDLYSTREIRSFHVAVLSPDTVLKDIEVTDDDLKAAWEASKSSFQQPERRSVEVILTQNADRAKALAAVWATGASWEDMQKQAAAEGDAAVELPDASRDEFPAPELADAVFAAAPGTVPPPVHSALGWHVLKVTGASGGGSKTFEQVKDELAARVRNDKAADLIDRNAGKIDDTLAGGTKIADLPADLGAQVLAVTADSTGAGATIPGGDAQRAAILAEAFRLKPGDPPHLTEAPRGQNDPPAYYALSVDTITPPTPRPMSEVADQVRNDWTADAVRHIRETQAANLLAAIKSGKTIAEAAAPQVPTTLPPVGRAAPAEGVPVQLIEPLFALKQGEPTMIETADGFVVAVLAEIRQADPNADPIGYGQVRDALSRSLADDLQASLTFAMRDRAAPKINRAAAESIARPE